VHDAGPGSDRGRNAEARDLLAPIYGWFTEGLGTPDLKEAKILLDALEEDIHGREARLGTSAWALIGRAAPS
jgi:predicted ATPase